MLIDANEVASGSVIQTQICIVGGGIAGIAMGLEFEKAGIDTVVLESGGTHRDEATSDLYRGPSVGIPYDFADGTRSRFLGGSSNCWGGFCRPWDQIAFDHRPWVKDSGWPIGRKDLDPFYERSHAILQVPSNEYRPDHWVGQAGEPTHGPATGQSRNASSYPFDPANIEEIISQFSPPLKMGEAYRDEIKAAKFLKLYLKANVAEIQCNPFGSTVESVKVRTLKGGNFTVQARVFVLASGGIENARLMLASNRQQSTGIGNRHDLVGRYFQDHPRFLNGVVEFNDKFRLNPLFDIKFHCIVDKVKISGADISGQMRVGFERQTEHGILDAQMWFRSLYAGEGTDIVRALYRMRQRVRGKWSPFVGLGTDLGHIFSHPLDSVGYTVAHTTGSRKLVRHVAMELICEPDPDPNSRVTLSDDIDALGMRRAKVDWRLGQQVKDTVDTSFSLLAKELEDKNIAKVKLGPRINDTGWPADMEGTYHHMGTTRMHDSPRHGVVDRNCKVHDMENLYIAGSSVFTTSSSNNPTMTLVALALRLSDRLTAEIKSGSTVTTDGAQTPAQPEQQAAA